MTASIRLSEVIADRVGADACDRQCRIVVPSHDAEFAEENRHWLHHVEGRQRHMGAIDAIAVRDMLHKLDLTQDGALHMPRGGRSWDVPHA